MDKISAEELMAKLANPNTPDAELKSYFIKDEDASAPFAPRFAINPETVEVPAGPEGAARSALAMNSANWFARIRRRRRFYDMLGSGYSGPVVVSEGDSWWQYPVFIKDTIDHLMDRFAVYDVAAAGDLLKNMAESREYMGALEETGASIFLFSGGGNDLLANGNLALHLEEFEPDLKPADFLKRSFQDLLDSSLGQYERILREVHGTFPAVQVICHGYDYPVPAAGRWLGRPMETRGIRDRGLQKAIAAEMMDQFNRGLRRVCRGLPHVRYIDCRRVVRDDRWYDELHPNDGGFKDVADKFAREIGSIANQRSGPVGAVKGPFARSGTIARQAFAGPEATAADGRSASLHIGLNSVDPGHYAEWTGTLLACENDAIAMQRIAARQGFDTKILLTRDATRAAVIAEIEQAAALLQAGDMFFLTISAHGGQIYDFNQDEVDDGDDRWDETWCLYDFQVADDELALCWTKFRDGVRILVVADTCHSGSPVRFSPFAPFIPGAAPSVEQPLVRAMPPHIQRSTLEKHFDEYRAYAKTFEMINEAVILNPSTSQIKASVLSLGACQDYQQALDGDEHGAFTGALLKVWDNGRFRGDYRSLRDSIDREILSDRQTPSLFDKLVRDPGFLSQVPFTIYPRAPGAASGSHPAAGVPSAGGPVTPATAGPGGGVWHPPLGGAGPMPSAPAAVQPTAEASAPPFADALADPFVALQADEGSEPDEAMADGTEAAADAARRSRSAATGWPEWPAYKSFIEQLALTHFAPEEFLELGSSHHGGGSCGGKNGFPPRALWPNIAMTAKTLDALRKRLGRAISISSAYRNEAYNSCIGGERNSLHKKFNAVDFTVSGVSPREVAATLRVMRDREGAFVGGIGRYNTFVHVDTRGFNATWPPAFASEAVRGGPGPQVASADRVEQLRSMPLALPDAPKGKRRRGGAAARAASPFARSVPRDGAEFDPTADVSARQQDMQAAVSASNIVTFAATLTPGQKEDVLLSTLFAERAANAAHDDTVEREAWYATYTDVLGMLGWATEHSSLQKNDKVSGEGNLAKVAIATLAAIATGNQIAIVKSAIDALEGLAGDDDAVTLFDFETSNAARGTFQLCSADASGDVISMALGAFSVTFKDRQRKVLFVSWGLNELDLWLAADRMTLGATAYEGVRDVVKERLKATRGQLIATIQI